MMVAAGSGLRTSRRVSHVFAMDVPSYPRPLFITDAAINIVPNLEEKRDIVQNAIDLANALGIANPKVAILSAVETVTGKLRSTLDAAALMQDGRARADCRRRTRRSSRVRQCHIADGRSGEGNSLCGRGSR